MYGLTPQARSIAAFLALAIHVAIGAHLIFTTRAGTGIAAAARPGVLVVELIPLSAEAPHGPVALPSEPVEHPAFAKPRLDQKISESGMPANGIRPVTFEAPPAYGIADASAAAPAMAAGGSSSVFQHALLRHIERFRHYPARARSGRVEGVALLSFSMDRDGNVVDAWVESSSGSVMLDAEALAAIQRAQPLPPIPPDLPDRLAIVLPISFALN